MHPQGIPGRMDPQASGWLRRRGWRMWGGLGRWAGGAPERVGASIGYALWAATYPPRAHNAVMAIEQSVMAPLLTAVSPRLALDVGTGTGRNLGVLAAAGARRAVGVDLSTAMLARASGGATRLCADAIRLPFRDHAFDVVCSSLMLGDIERIDEWTAEAARVLRPRGHLVYSDFHPEWASRGWRRTFRAADGRAFELPYFPHTLGAHLDALERAGLSLRTVREPGLPRTVIILFHAVKG